MVYSMVFSDSVSGFIDFRNGLWTKLANTDINGKCLEFIKNMYINIIMYQLLKLRSLNMEYLLIFLLKKM